MLNFINKPNFNLPNLLRGNRAFGRITSLIEGNEARIIQLGLPTSFKARDTQECVFHR